MPVAHWKQGGESIGPKQIHAPKEASLRGWWNACRKVFPDLPVMGAIPRLKGEADIDFIHFQWADNDIFIARKRNMR